MSVMQRKLFANQEARTKLRDMGGIMSSFPELSGEVQRFQEGGGVAAPTGYSYARWSMMTPAARRAAGLPSTELEARRYFPDAPLAAVSAEDVALGLGVDQEFAQPAGGGGISVADILNGLFGEAAMSRVREARSEPEEREQRVATAEEVERGSADDAGNRIAALAQQDAEEIAAEREAAGITTAEGSPGALLASGDTEGAGAAFDRIREIVTPERAGRIADLVPTPGEEEVDADAETDTETDTDRLRARAEERIQLFQDLFGSDEPTARDRAMQFAMIGLAIAAGQSPNALTNIASGLLAGTEAMSAAEQERRSERRSLRSAAVDSVLREIEAEREAEADSGVEYQPTESYADAVLRMTETLISEGELPAEADRLARQLVDPLYGRPGGTGAAVPVDATPEELELLGIGG